MLVTANLPGRIEPIFEAVTCHLAGDVVVAAIPACGCVLAAARVLDVGEVDVVDAWTDDVYAAAVAGQREVRGDADACDDVGACPQLQELTGLVLI